MKSASSFYGYYGQEEKNNYPSYDYKSILGSVTHQKLNPYFKPLSIGNIEQLRNEAELTNCRKENAIKNVTFALFDLQQDPCETNDLAQEQPRIVAKLMRRLKYFEDQLIPQQNTEPDPCSDPKYYNGYWSTWLSDPVTKCQ